MTLVGQGGKSVRGEGKDRKNERGENKIEQKIKKGCLLLLFPCMTD